MSNRIEMVSASAAAHDISQAANLVYWLSEKTDADRAAFHERDLHEQFKKLADILGYRVDRQADELVHEMQSDTESV